MKVMPKPSDKPDHPTHPTKGANEVNAGKIHETNDHAKTQSAKDHMVDIGRGENTSGRQK